jgi:hypothetical protein
LSPPPLDDVLDSEEAAGGVDEEVVLESDPLLEDEL